MHRCSSMAAPLTAKANPLPAAGRARRHQPAGWVEGGSLAGKRSLQHSALQAISSPFPCKIEGIFTTACTQLWMKSRTGTALQWLQGRTRESQNAPSWKAPIRICRWPERPQPHQHADSRSDSFCSFHTPEQPFQTCSLGICREHV